MNNIDKEVDNALICISKINRIDFTEDFSDKLRNVLSIISNK